MIELGLTRAELEAAWAYALGAEMPRVSGYLMGALETAPEVNGLLRFWLVDAYAVDVLAVISELAAKREALTPIWS